MKIVKSASASAFLFAYLMGIGFPPAFCQQEPSGLSEWVTPAQLESSAVCVPDKIPAGTANIEGISESDWINPGSSALNAEPTPIWRFPPAKTTPGQQKKSAIPLESNGSFNATQPYQLIWPAGTGLNGQGIDPEFYQTVVVPATKTKPAGKILSGSAAKIEASLAHSPKKELDIADMEVIDQAGNPAWQTSSGSILDTAAKTIMSPQTLDMIQTFGQCIDFGHPGGGLGSMRYGIVPFRSHLGYRY